MKKIAIIPARGGSKRIPDKNIRLFLGKPIISYPIQAAFDSGLFEEVMVSTDSELIADIAREYGAKVPFTRSSENASDLAPLKDVVLEVLNKYSDKGLEFDYFCCLLPASPLIRAERLSESFRILKETNSSSLVPVVKYSHPIQRAFRINESSRLEMMWPENLLKRTQDLESTYHDSGSFYWVKTDLFLKEGTFFTGKSVPLVLPESEVQDIDDAQDWLMAEMKFKKMFF
jgi:pseudaminic acid cytidylyltransferase